MSRRSLRAVWSADIPGPLLLHPASEASMGYTSPASTFGTPLRGKPLVHALTYIDTRAALIPAYWITSSQYSSGSAKLKASRYVRVVGVLGQLTLFVDRPQSCVSLLPAARVLADLLSHQAFVTNSDEADCLRIIQVRAPCTRTASTRCCARCSLTAMC